MKLIIFLTVVACFQASAKGNAQTVSLSVKDAPLEKVFKEIRKQTGYDFWYENTLLAGTKKITLNVRNVMLEEVLKLCFKDQPLSYTIIDKTIILKLKPVNVEPINLLIDVKGKVVNENGEPLEGVTVSVKGSTKATATNAKGEFSLTGVDENGILVFTATNIETYEMKIVGRSELIVNVKDKISKLDEVQIIGYGQTTRRLNTSDVTKVSKEDISKTPVSNPILALQGRTPGIFIQSNGGMPGANFQIQIRGISSVTAGNSPLYIIDGVPFISNSMDLISASSNTNIAGGLSPLNSLNPLDIESIEILKDADATAIYGSRGANGVVLITTTKAKPGKTRLSFDTYQGIEKVGHFIDMLSITDYLQLRRMAFLNDGVTPTIDNAPDLVVWDTTKNTNWQKELLGGTAPVTNIQLNLSGGDAKTRFIVGANVRREGAVFQTSTSDLKLVGHINVDHRSISDRLKVNISVNYSAEKNNLINDPSAYVNLPPNYIPFDSSGKVIWRPVGSVEPFAILKTSFANQTNNFISNGIISYDVVRNLKLKASLGFNDIYLNQQQKNPINAQNPANNPTPTALFGDNHITNWIVEPQINYHKTAIHSTYDFLVGTTYQQTITQGKLIRGNNFTSDVLLDNIAAAGSISFLANNYVLYRYNSLFGRITFNHYDRYILNASFRRDGSTRFGPGKQYGNFGAVGTAWIFSEEPFFQKLLRFINFGKIRLSYGITGNDQITDYQYMSTYTTTSFGYLTTGLRPARIANPDYSWETNRKFEAALDLSLINDRLDFSIAYYRNRSGNQLVNYPLPSQTGFSSYQANLPALVQNTGFEIQSESKIISQKNFQWNVSMNLSILRNKLISFPNIEGTSYNINNLVVGQPLNLLWGYHYLGVDPASGNAILEDKDKNGSFSSADYFNLGTTLPKYFGGLNTTIAVKNLQLDILFQYAKKIARTVNALWVTIPGSINNQNQDIFNSMWKQPGSQSSIPKARLSGGSFTQYISSDAGLFEDASYLKLKNLSVSYSVPLNKLKNKLNNVKLYLQGQNLATITKYNGYDPETGSLSLPNLRIIVLGIHCEF